MTYKCIECGYVFDDGEQAVFENDCKEFWGAPCKETFSCCPMCGGDYGEAVPCDCCGEYTLKEELEMNGDICAECMEKYMHDFEMCSKISKLPECDPDEIKINSLLTSIFSEKEIESILFDILKKRTESDEWKKGKGFENFVDQDAFWFTSALNKILKSEKNKND